MVLAWEERLEACQGSANGIIMGFHKWADYEQIVSQLISLSEDFFLLIMMS